MTGAWGKPMQKVKIRVQDFLARLPLFNEDDDGSFRNGESPLMKEDDRLLATTLAVSALSACRAR